MLGVEVIFYTLCIMTLDGHYSLLHILTNLFSGEGPIIHLIGGVFLGFVLNMAATKLLLVINL
jgi:hypothetical protein